MAYEAPKIELIEINPSDIVRTDSNVSGGGEDNNFPVS